jgi:hypothetical protein
LYATARVNKVSPGEKVMVEVPTQVVLVAACAAGASPAADRTSNATTRTSAALLMIMTPQVMALFLNGREH